MGLSFLGYNMPPKAAKKPDPKAKGGKAGAKSSKSGGKAKKKKWSKGKVKDKANNLVLLDKTTHDKLYKEVPAFKLITPAVLVDRLKVNGSLARKILSVLLKEGTIKQIVGHSALSIYTRTTGDEEEEAEA